MITAVATFFLSTSSFHRPRLRPCPRRLTFVHPARATTGSSSSSSWEEREEARWLREEQRWLREESRWRAESEALLAEVAALRLRLRVLEGSPPPHHYQFAEVDAWASPAVPAPQPRPALVEEVEVRKEKVVVEEKKAASLPKADEGGKTSRRRTLRAGAEGDDVRAMQVSVVAGLSFWLGFDVCL
jgi:protein disulfide-isomerase